MHVSLPYCFMILCAVSAMAKLCEDLYQVGHVDTSKSPSSHPNIPDALDPGVLGFHSHIVPSGLGYGTLHVKRVLTQVSESRVQYQYPLTAKTRLLASRGTADTPTKSGGGASLRRCAGKINPWSVLHIRFSFQ
ncbi:hypothetical protein CBL_14117 [Carabus blaptoides fortunei]